MINLSVKNPVMVNLTMIIVIIIGAWKIFIIPKETIPAIDIGKFRITVSYPGVSAEEIESLVVDKIEKKLSSLSELEKISSKCHEGGAYITLDLIDNINIDNFFNKVSKIIDTTEDLPNDLKRPVLKNININEVEPVCKLAVSGNYSGHNLNKIAEEIKADLTKFKNISKTEIVGSKIREIHIKLDKNRINNHELTIKEIEESVKKNNISFPVGVLKNNSSETIIKAESGYTGIENLLNLPVKKTEDKIIYLKNIAEITYSYKKNSPITRLDSQPCIYLNIYQSLDANIVKVVNDVKSFIKAGAGKKYDIKLMIIDDRSGEVKNNITALSYSALAGVLLVFISLYFFLGFNNAVLAALEYLLHLC